MVKVDVRVVGTANVLSNISLWQNIKFREEIRKNLNITRLEIENTARRMAPKDSGLLKASIGSEMVNDEEAIVFDGVFYGFYQEVGFHHWKSGKFIINPFLRPAFEIGKKKFEERMKKVLK